MSGVFVGRRRELKVPLDKLAGATTGAGCVVMLAGEPGIGKTAIASVVAGLARERGATVIRGSCFEGGWKPAWGPWSRPSAATSGWPTPRGSRPGSGRRRPCWPR
ncbi:MAG: AAA family ATPase [Acidimicrobiales bacterium]